MVGLELPAVAERRSLLATRESTSDAVALGRWMVKALPTTAFVLADYQTYAPVEFADVAFVWGRWSRPLSRRPDYLVGYDHVESAIQSRGELPWRDEAAARGYQEWIRCGQFTLYVAVMSQDWVSDRIRFASRCTEIRADAGEHKRPWSNYS